MTGAGIYGIFSGHWLAANMPEKVACYNSLSNYQATLETTAEAYRFAQENGDGDKQTQALIIAALDRQGKAAASTLRCHKSAHRTHRRQAAGQLVLPPPSRPFRPFAL